MITEEDERNYRYYDVYEDVYISNGNSVESLIRHLFQIKNSKNWDNDLKLSIDFDDGDTYLRNLEFQVYGRVKRTDKEILELLEIAKNAKLWQEEEKERLKKLKEENELKEYKRLHQKYGDKNG